MGFLPQVGSTYSSFAALKLDVLERGFPFGFNFTTRSSLGNDYIDFRCNGRRKSSSVCSCRVLGRKNATGLVQVVRIFEGHSCSRSSRMRNRGGGRFSSARKIQRLRREVTSVERRRLRQIREAKPAKGESDHQEGDSEEESASGKEAALPRRRLRVRRTHKSMKEVSEDETEEEDDDESESSSEAESEAQDSTERNRQDPRALREDTKGLARERRNTARQYPRASEVQNEINQLLSSGVVPFPTFEDQFNSPRELLIRLYAHAQQRGFSVHRRSESSLMNRLRISCHRSNKSYENTAGGTCPFKLTAKEGKDGIWRVLRVEAHNHEIMEPVIKKVEISQTDSHDFGKALPSLSPRKRLRQSSSPSPPLPNHDNIFPTPSNPYRARLNAKRPPPCHSQPSTSSSDSSQFSLLVKSFLPPSSPQLSNLITMFTLLGISDVGTLTSILMMEKRIFEKFVRKVEDVETRQLLEVMERDLKGCL
ncbi:hypothetical protein JCM3765_000711 [Sporobolomyces pararoseus]